MTKNGISMKKTIIPLLFAGIVCTCTNRQTPSQSNSTEQQEQQQENAVVPSATFDSLINIFPKWTADTITNEVLSCRLEQFPYSRTIPKGMAEVYFLDNDEERNMASHYDFYGGFRIDTAACHILFVRRDLDEHNINDDGGYPYCSYEVMTFSTKGEFIDKMEVAKYGDFWSSTLCGTRQPLRLHVEKASKTDFDGDISPFPIYVDEIEVRIAADGKILTDTLRSYISYARDEEDANGMFVLQWDRNSEEPVHE